jgi:surface protein
MFYELENIIRIDFSDLDISSVSDMVMTFYNCTSLSSINFNNNNHILQSRRKKLFSKFIGSK